jgi:glycosyltransferase involved in cell wall biosynthesis|tara:strand:- start:29116 stop:30003 length:888 start_codon:yes stop_codon:yes gene_type:complete
MPKTIIISIPAYNEERSIGLVIQEIKQVMNKTDYNYKISIVNDGSRDSTIEAAKKAGAIVHSHPYNYGLAETFRTEMKQALNLKADIIVHTDADGQYLAQEIPRLIKEVENGYDLVLGSRFRGKIVHMSFLKRLGNKAFSKVISQITRLRITDGQTGFRAFTKEVAKLDIISSHTYTQEQIIKAVFNKFRIKEIPVYFDTRKHGKSRLLKNPLEYAVKAWINLFRIYRDYTPLKFFGSFGLLFLSIGFLIGLYLVSLFILTGKVGHLPLTMVSVLLILLGVQIIFFGFLADMRKN